MLEDDALFGDTQAQPSASPSCRRAHTRETGAGSALRDSKQTDRSGMPRGMPAQRTTQSARPSDVASIADIRTFASRECSGAETRELDQRQNEDDEVHTVGEQQHGDSDIAAPDHLFKKPEQGGIERAAGNLLSPPGNSCATFAARRLDIRRGQRDDPRWQRNPLAC